MKKFGSQNREPLDSAGMKLVKRLNKKEVVLEDTDGKQEVWVLNDHHAGYTIDIDGKGYEFAGNYTKGEYMFDSLKVGETVNASSLLKTEVKADGKFLPDIEMANQQLQQIGKMLTNMFAIHTVKQAKMEYGEHLRQVKKNAAHVVNLLDQIQAPYAVNDEVFIKAQIGETFSIKAGSFKELAIDNKEEKADDKEMAK